MIQHGFHGENSNIAGIDIRKSITSALAKVSGHRAGKASCGNYLPEQMSRSSRRVNIAGIRWVQKCTGRLSRI